MSVRHSVEIDFSGSVLAYQIHRDEARADTHTHTRLIIQSMGLKSFIPLSGRHDTKTSGFAPKSRPTVAVFVLMRDLLSESRRQQSEQ